MCIRDSCHTGRQSCFYQKLDSKRGIWQAVDDIIKDPNEIYSKANQSCINSMIISQLDGILDERKSADKDSSYVASLYHKGLNKILEKVGEESTEAIIAAKELQLVQSQHQDDAQAKSDVVYEVADVWFHSLVALHQLGLSGADVLDELGRRFGLSGIDEKNARMG